MRPAGKEPRVEADCEPAMCHCSKKINSLLACIRESLGEVMEVMEVIFPSALERSGVGHSVWTHHFEARHGYIYWNESRNEM